MILIKRFVQIFLVLILLLLLVIVSVNYYVTKSTLKNLFTEVENTPYNKVGLLLGTSKYTKAGYLNLYFKNRIEAAVELYKAGKIDYIIVSGDNSTKNYNEPKQMRKDLEDRGVPNNKIFEDYAGFRTLDSVVRSKAIFGQESITVISQKFHNERALMIAKYKGVNAIGFNANDVSSSYGLRTNIREKFARVKMMLDLTFGKNPKFLGEEIEIQ